MVLGKRDSRPILLEMIMPMGLRMVETISLIGETERFSNTRRWEMVQLEEILGLENGEGECPPRSMASPQSRSYSGGIRSTWPG